ncbi:hypothetical protein PTI45_03327 [Paenibacillus nuruki]|uniref:Metallo-beta-lactamase domain-containing protein n=1 Tax=Paenibacillus nuruki TaxID=1886670 RepID=A0A1E3L079_9BACL|nr:MBL fold metallo-hydrolase [Paenibacillus nuruki]ODP27202.1 hypothetical protein PTI45_03327 [Paenibacillus nuruki]
MFSIKSLPAHYGDCILIRYGEQDKKNNILIDGGITRTYIATLKKEIQNIIDRGEFIDLLIVTHIHDDHLRGILKFFSDSSMDKSLIKKVWFNSNKILAKYIQDLGIEEINLYDEASKKMSYSNSITFENKLEELGIANTEIVYFNKSYNKINFEGAMITVLTPNIVSLQTLNIAFEKEASLKTSAELHDFNIEINEVNVVDDLEGFIEDDAPFNISSISCILEYNEKTILLLADSTPKDVILGIKSLGYSIDNPLKVDFVKISHHGSKANTNIELLKHIKCSKYIISTNGSKRGAPSKEMLSKIILTQENVELIFNYDIYNEIFTQEEMQKYNFTCLYTIDEMEV